MIERTGEICRAVLRTFTWQKLLLTQLLVVALDVIALLSFSPLRTTPSTFFWSRPVIEEIMALSIVIAVAAADQAIARGARAFRAYAVALLAAAVVAATSQFQIRHWLGIYTSGDQPGRAIANRRMQMIYVGSDTVTYGALFVLVYLDYRRREALLKRLRGAELGRARKERRVVEAKLGALRAHVDAAELLATLRDLEQRVAVGLPDADDRLDALIASLRARLSPVPDEHTAASV